MSGAGNSKCNICTLNCTLEEIAVLNYLRERPNATQKEIAAHIGKSERTVKTITVRLVRNGILERKNGKRDGFWEIKTDELTSQNSRQDVVPPMLSPHHVPDVAEKPVAQPKKKRGL